MTQDMTTEEIRAAEIAVSHCRALRVHLEKSVNELYLFDRVMQLAQHRDLSSIDADRLAELRLRIEDRREGLAEDLEEVKDLPTILTIGFDDHLEDEDWRVIESER